MTFLGRPPQWGLLVMSPLLFALFAAFFVACAVQHVADQVRCR